ncbi:MAG: VWA domain-containing protein [Xenococcaceae cyanobacterium MO_188.B32]|nr:VWA domain-containing protein [Xenococcaceae cyanobacterium MO_188.B32]
MKVNYSFSQSSIAVSQATTVDVILNFYEKTDKSSDFQRLPLNLALVLDRSGSMAGYPLQNAKTAAQQLVEYLTSEDYLSVVIYDDKAQTVLPTQLVTDKSNIKNIIGKIGVGGCTNLSGGWLMGCDNVQSQQDKEKLNRVLLLTDGQANVGVVDPQVLTKTAQEKAEAGIFTTTLGFGHYFNEDLLISMADAGKGNFYFIQSPEDAADVFRVEMESLVSVVAQNLKVQLELTEGVEVTELLNSYSSTKNNNILEIFLGDVYGVETKPLALQFSLPSFAAEGDRQIAKITYSYETIVDGSIQKQSDSLTLSIKVVSSEEAEKIEPDAEVDRQTSQLRIAKVKDEAVSFADKGNYLEAAKILRETVKNLQLKALDEYFTIAEEIEQLDYYAQSLEKKRFDLNLRKEMRDQSYQARKRDREDLQLRGSTVGASSNLPRVTEAGDGIVLKCEKIKAKLRIRVISDGYNPDLNVQFPRSIREEGVTYVVDELILSAKGNFYRTSGEIKRLLKPGEVVVTNNSRVTRQLAKSKVTCTAADLETTDTIGDCVLVQCIKDKSKLRVRVVSDGYNPDWNMRFPKSIREEGMLYVVDDVKESSSGGFYWAYGKIKRFIQ